MAEFSEKVLPGGKLTVADFHVASVVLLLDLVQLDYSRHSHIQRWATACHACPALPRARG